MPRPSDDAKVGELYFIESIAQEAVKIGFGSDVATRLATLQTGNPAELVFLVSLPCTYGAEKRLHHVLKDRRIRLEWYRRDEFIEALMEELQNAAFELGWDELIAVHGNQPVETTSLQHAADLIWQAERKRPLTEADIELAIDEVMAELAA